MTLDLSEAPVATFPKSVQPGIPRLGSPKSGWATYRFGDLLEVVARPVRMIDAQEYDLVTVKRSRGGIEKRATLAGAEISVKSQFRIEGGDFLISRRQIVHGACAIVPKEFSGSIVSNEYAVLRCKLGLDLDFLKYLTHSIYFQQTCFHSSIGVHVEKMIFKLETWLDFQINIPSVEEQERLGRGFAAVDAKLDALRRKKSGLEAFKSGLMNRLFSQDLRFTRDDGTDFPDWETMTFDEAVIRPSEKVDPRRTLFGAHVIDLENLESGTGRIFHMGTVEDSASLKSAFKAGDVLFGKLRPYLRKFARPKFDGCCSSEIWVLRGKKVLNEFLFYLVQSPRFIELATISSGSKMPRADWGVISTGEFEIPHPDEQRKIADALSAMDTKIAAVADQIIHMETFKKGLLQQMFV